MGLGWILASCVVLSFYDLSKKASVRDNAVFPVLLGSTLTGFLAVTAFLIARGGFAATLGVGAGTMGLLLLKSCIVGASWTATYMALRTLPITSAAPIRATGPLWTLIVGLPSTVWCNLPVFRKLRQKKGIPYSRLYCESWANRLGEKFTGEKIRGKIG